MATLCFSARDSETEATHFAAAHCSSGERNSRRDSAQKAGAGDVAVLEGIKQSIPSSMGRMGLFFRFFFECDSQYLLSQTLTSNQLDNDPKWNARPAPLFCRMGWGAVGW